MIILSSSVMSCKTDDSNTIKSFDDEDITIEKDIVFFDQNKLKLRLDIYRPKNTNKEQKLKPVLWIHGGEFKPSIDKEQDYIVDFCRYLAKEGYLCISSDYRIAEDAFSNWYQAISNAGDDTLHAIEWIKKNEKKYSLDLNYLTIAGGSMGGMISIFATTSYTHQKKTPPLFAYINLWGTPFNLEQSIPENFPPTLIVHGKKDETIPYKNTLSVSKILEGYNIYHEIMAIEDAGHTPVSHFDEIALRIKNFLKKLGE